MSILSSLGIGSLVWCRALGAQVAQQNAVTAEMIQQAEWIAGLELTDDERQQTIDSMTSMLNDFQQLREVNVDHHDEPAFAFNPAPWLPPSGQPVVRNQARLVDVETPPQPVDDTALAFLPVAKLAPLMRSRQITSVQLTKLYLGRLKKYDPLLKCVVTLTEDLALRQAAEADREIAAGHYRGLLHGIPWGAKDLIAVPGYPTTWGAAPFKEQRLDITATVAERLQVAGAVLVGKLAMGALAMGDQWFGGMTRNPWNPVQGSSGSSAGSASAVAAGLVGFAIGTETHGSIISPCRRCGATGLRPTFGRVSRFGCMPLSWTLDKLGPITRGVEDCAIVLDAIHGFDGQDSAAVDRPFAWPPTTPLSEIRVGYVKNRIPAEERSDLQVLKELGVQLLPIQLPASIPVAAQLLMLDVEAATVFEDLTRKHVTESLNSWPATFRKGLLIPAVEYLRASRVRRLLMTEMKQLMDTVDVYVGGRDITLGNMTGHPTVVMPNQFRSNRDGLKTPGYITFTGQLYGETALLSVAKAWQNATGFHLQQPDIDVFLKASVKSQGD